MSSNVNNGSLPPLIPGDATISNGIFTKNVHMYEDLLVDGGITAETVTITSTNTGLTVDKISCDSLVASVGITSATLIVTGTALGLTVSGSSVLQNVAATGVSSTVLNVTTVTAGTLNVSGSSVLQNLTVAGLNATGNAVLGTAISSSVSLNCTSLGFYGTTPITKSTFSVGGADVVALANVLSNMGLLNLVA